MMMIENDDSTNRFYGCKLDLDKSVHSFILDRRKFSSVQTKRILLIYLLLYLISRIDTQFN
jgi:hypothetical protein